MTTPATSPVPATPSTTVSAHVLDAVAGAPAVGLDLVVTTADGTTTTATTDADGRVRLADPVPAGTTRVTFASGAWWAARGQVSVHPEIAVAVDVEPGRAHLHLALLLSPFAYTTYRGS